jgi:hypothetical protein
MRILRFLTAGRSVLALCAFSLAAFAAGCGDTDVNATAPGQATSQEQLDKEKAAREAAYGKGGNATRSTGNASKSPAGRTGSRPG